MDRADRRLRMVVASALALAFLPLQATAQDDGSLSRFAVSGTAWFGNTHVSHAERTDAGPGFGLRVEYRLGAGRLSLEYGVLQTSGSAHFSIREDIHSGVPAAACSTPLRSRHLLVGYEFRVAGAYVRPSVGFAEHMFRVRNPELGTTDLSNEVGPALALAVGLRVARLGIMGLLVEGLYRYSRGEDSPAPRHFLGVGLTLALR